MELKRIKTFETETTKLTEFCRNTAWGEQSVMECENLREFGSARTTAYNVKSEVRNDGYKYKVSLDTIAQTVTISLTD